MALLLALLAYIIQSAAAADGGARQLGRQPQSRRAPSPATAAAGGVALPDATCPGFRSCETCLVGLNNECGWCELSSNSGGAFQPWCWRGTPEGPASKKDCNASEGGVWRAAGKGGDIEQLCAAAWCPAVPDCETCNATIGCTWCGDASAGSCQSSLLPDCESPPTCGPPPSPSPSVSPSTAASPSVSASAGVGNSSSPSLSPSLSPVAANSTSASPSYGESPSPSSSPIYNSSTTPSLSPSPSTSNNASSVRGAEQRKQRR